MANKNLSIYIEESYIRKLDENAKKMRRTRNSLATEAIEIYLDTLKNEPKTNGTKKAGKQ